MTSRKVLRLYPGPHRECELEGLYLDHPLSHEDDPHKPFVYTNFISSLDGRIAVEDPRKGGHSVPAMITNPRDWRLFQELAAQADVLMVSARFLRELAAGKAQDVLPLSGDPAYADLQDWRTARGMTPQPAVVVLSRSLDVPLAELCHVLDRRVYFALGADAVPGDRAAVESTGARILTAGHGAGVEGNALIEALGEEGFRRIYSIAGPGVLQTLVKARVLHRLYLTHFHRLLGGRSFDTMLEGELLDPPASFIPRALYYDPQVEAGVGQFFTVYDVVS